MGWAHGRLFDHGQLWSTGTCWNLHPDGAGHTSPLEGLTHRGMWEQEDAGGAQSHGEGRLSYWNDDTSSSPPISSWWDPSKGERGGLGFPGEGPLISLGS